MLLLVGNSEYRVSPSFGEDESEMYCSVGLRAMYIEQTFKVSPPDVKCEPSDGPLLPETDLISQAGPCQWTGK